MESGQKIPLSALTQETVAANVAIGDRQAALGLARGARKGGPCRSRDRRRLSSSPLGQSGEIELPDQGLKAAVIPDRIEKRIDIQIDETRIPAGECRGQLGKGPVLLT